MRTHHVFIDSRFVKHNLCNLGMLHGQCSRVVKLPHRPSPIAAFKAHQRKAPSMPSKAVPNVVSCAFLGSPTPPLTIIVVTLAWGSFVWTSYILSISYRQIVTCYRFLVNFMESFKLESFTESFKLKTGKLHGIILTGLNALPAVFFWLVHQPPIAF